MQRLLRTEPVRRGATGLNRPVRDANLEFDVTGATLMAAGVSMLRQWASAEEDLVVPNTYHGCPRGGGARS